jgi:cell wall-associated NlpC family hydrolase
VSPEETTVTFRGTTAKGIEMEQPTSRWRLASLGLVLALAFTSFAAVGATGSAVKRSSTCARLAEGSVGPAVVTIQQLVRTTPDGDFGPMTKAAVSKWQKRKGLDVTGVVDGQTWAALPRDVRQEACAKQVHGSGAAVSCAQLANGADGPAVEVLQRAVKTDVDGAFGPMTETAVRKAQRAARLDVTGVADPATWAALGLTGTPACMAAPPKPVSHELTPNEKANRKIANQVQQLAAELLDTPATEPGRLVAAALAFAKTQKGKPYQWGGVGPKGFDCSGLVMTSYLHAGVTMPRVAADQYGAGKVVPLNLARPGDLLFYADDLTRPSTIHHVVIYLGGGRVLDAPYTGAFVGTRSMWTRGLLPVVTRPAAPVELPLRPRAKGWSVTQLQLALNRHGAGVSVDGGYGPSTLAAVKAWKRAHSLGPSGYVGRTTWLSLGVHPNHRFKSR